MRHALEVMKDVHNSLLLGLFTGATCEVNPPSTRVITAQDQMLVVRSRPVDHVGFEAVTRT